jgi:hypothetical protein
VLAAFAESDFIGDAVGVDKGGNPFSFGVFQQVPRFWPTAHGTTAEQCEAFLNDFRGAARHHNGDPVHDCWVTQRWGIPGAAWPDPGPQFAEQKVTPGTSTHNYARRVTDVPRIISERRLP